MDTRPGGHEAAELPSWPYGELKFLEAVHVKDFIAAVRLLDNPLDEIAWYRLCAGREPCSVQ